MLSVYYLREPVPQRPEPTDQADVTQRVEHMADLLRNNQECLHRDTWAYISGGGTCEECHDYLELYLYRCRVCHLMACRRCRYNRL